MKYNVIMFKNSFNSIQFFVPFSFDGRTDMLCLLIFIPVHFVESIGCYHKQDSFDLVLVVPRSVVN